MLVPSTFTGWYRNTMMISARPMAISRSRVHTRSSLRKEWSAGDGSEVALVGLAGAGASGATLVGEFLSSVLCIFRCLVFITRPSRVAPDFDFSGVRLRYPDRSPGMISGPFLPLDALYLRRVACRAPV